jgi:signal transduction histidine kinase
VQHSPSGVVEITVSADAAGVTIRMTDQGPGIPPDEQDRIFEPVRAARFRQAEGRHGVGLPIARWIAEAHHGTLTLESSGPDGSTFSIFLPRR